MNKRMTTSSLKNLILHLKKQFKDQMKGHAIDLQQIEVHAQVLHINHKTRQTEQIRIPDAFLNHNLPIPDNSVLQIHVLFPHEIDDRHMKTALNSVIKDQLQEKDFRIESDKIIFNNLKLLDIFNSEC
jgi:hypothetical protein